MISHLGQQLNFPISGFNSLYSATQPRRALAFRTRRNFAAGFSTAPWGRQTEWGRTYWFMGAQHYEGHVLLIFGCETNDILSGAINRSFPHSSLCRTYIIYPVRSWFPLLPKTHLTCLCYGASGFNRFRFF